MRLQKLVLLCVLAFPGISVLPQDSLCPVQLLEVSDNGERFELLEQGKVYLKKQLAPLYMVPVVGTYRSGKSFLLNRLMDLKAPYIGGFGVGHTQDTFSTGISVCAEWIPGLGTVVWMDTEGLFSMEDAKGEHGVKLFSFALLVSSVILLNSKAVLSSQFFDYFGEQQKTARVLAEALVEEGLPESMVLPRNLSIHWILSQPVEVSTEAALQRQLNGFLQGSVFGSDKDLRALVRRDFGHMLHQLPTAISDSDLWKQLETLPDEKLKSAFVEAGAKLRANITVGLRSARAWVPASIAEVLNSYVQLVHERKFSPQDARRQFEEAKISQVCREFALTARETAGEMPSTTLAASILAARTEADVKVSGDLERFHLGREWLHRMQACITIETSRLENDNEEALVVKWREETWHLAERGTQCFFADQLFSTLSNLTATYNLSLSPEVEASTNRLVLDMQRVRLFSCLRAKDILFPLLPWIALPSIRRYPSISIFWTTIYSTFFYLGYTTFQSLGLLPQHLDLDFPVLQAWPISADILMFVVGLCPWMPWHSAGTLVLVVGLLLCFAVRFRAARSLRGGIINVEMMERQTLVRLNGLINERLVAGVLAAAGHASRGDEGMLLSALLPTLGLFADRVGIGADPQLGVVVNDKLRERVQRLLKNPKLHARVMTPEVDGSRLCDAWLQLQPGVVANVLAGSWTKWNKVLWPIVRFLEDGLASD